MNLKKIIIELAIIAFIFPLIILGIWSVTGSWIYPSLLPQSYSLRGFQYILSLDNILKHNFSGTGIKDLNTLIKNKKLL